MKAWYSKVRDTELIDGSVRADYVVTFETDSVELKRKVEKYLQGIMDEAEQTEPSNSEKPNNCEDEFFREPTAEERKAVADYIDSISVPTGVNVFDLMDEQTAWEKSASKAVLTARCLNCHNAKACKENNWQGCRFEPIEDEPQTETSTNSEKLQSGVELKQTDCAWK